MPTAIVLLKYFLSDFSARFNRWVDALGRRRVRHWSLTDAGASRLKLRGCNTVERTRVWETRKWHPFSVPTGNNQNETTRTFPLKPNLQYWLIQRLMQSSFVSFFYVILEFSSVYFYHIIPTSLPVSKNKLHSIAAWKILVIAVTVFVVLCSVYFLETK